MSVLAEIKRHTPKVLVLLAGIIWAGLIRQGYEEQLVAPGEVNTDVVIQYYDRELRLLEGAKRGDAIEKWLSGADDQTAWLEDLAATAKALYQEDLGETADDLLGAIDFRLGKFQNTVDTQEDAEQRAKVRQWLLDGNGRAWDFDLYLASGDDAMIRSIYQNENDKLLQRVWWAGIVNFSILGASVIGGIFWIIGKKRAYLRASRIPDAWPASYLLGLFFLADILVIPWMMAIDVGYEIYYSLGGIGELEALSDFLWRTFSTLFLTVLFLKYPVHLWRVFGLARRVDWLLVLASFGVMALIDWCLFSFAPVSETDPTDFMEVAFLDGYGLAALLFSSVVVAPIFEEIVFRGFLFQGLRGKTGAIWAAIISSAFFALTHTQYDSWGWLSVGTMGMIACYLTYRTGSLKSSMAMHALGNLLITLDVYFHYQLPL